MLAAARPNPPDMLGKFGRPGLWLPDLPDLDPTKKGGVFAESRLVLDRLAGGSASPGACPGLRLPTSRPAPGRWWPWPPRGNRRYGNITLDDFSAQVQAKYPAPFLPSVWARGRSRAGVCSMWNCGPWKEC